jgi:hypothetical protein
MPLLYAFGFIFAFFVVLRIIDGINKKRAWKKLDAAREEFAEIAKEYGTIRGRDHCPHKVVTFGQTGVPGVVTMTTKWCNVCGKHLGSAKLKTSMFGNRWE